MDFKQATVALKKCQEKQLHSKAKQILLSARNLTTIRLLLTRSNISQDFIREVLVSINKKDVISFVVKNKPGMRRLAEKPVMYIEYVHSFFILKIAVVCEKTFYEMYRRKFDYICGVLETEWSLMNNSTKDENIFVLELCRKKFSKGVAYKVNFEHRSVSLFNLGHTEVALNKLPNKNKSIDLYCREYEGSLAINIVHRLEPTPDMMAKAITLFVKLHGINRNAINYVIYDKISWLQSIDADITSVAGRSLLRMEVFECIINSIIGSDSLIKEMPLIA